MTTDLNSADTLAVIADRLITIQDFYRRAEYTPRPDYCNGTNYIHKKIILNSLIAEKLLALDSEEAETFIGNANVESFLTGCREQAMRQIYFYDQAYRIADPTSEEIESAYKMGNRTVRLQYFNIPDEERAREVMVALGDGVSFDEIYSVFSNLDSIPERSINWLAKNEDPNLLNMIFTDEMASGKVVGPVTAKNGSILLIRIQGWTERVLISETEQRKHWNDVKEKLVHQGALNIYGSKLRELMSGRELIFNSNVFMPYARSLADNYLRTQEEQKDIFEESIWNEDRSPSVDSSFPEYLKNEEFFTFDGQSFTITDFENMLKKHPLVFRNKKLSLSRFPGEFQMAVADLLQDMVLTEECYKLGYDKHQDVLSNEFLWRDAVVADAVKWNTIAGISDTSLHKQEPIRKIEAVLNPIIRDLQIKYSGQIRINMDKFEQIDLTSTPMVVIQPGMPYPVIVPQFPIITTLSRLDYGQNISN